MPILRDGELDIISHSPDQTRRFGIRLGKLLRPGDVICLSGDMGAGKTVFSAGIGEGWGSKNRVTSPTYTLVHEHKREQDNTTLYHLDCYRMQNENEVDTIGFDEIMDSNGVVLIEWAERIESALPENYLWIELLPVEDLRRNFVLEAHGDHYQKLVDDFRNAIFGR